MFENRQTYGQKRQGHGRTDGPTNFYSEQNLPGPNSDITVYAQTLITTHKHVRALHGI